jgi:NADH dehydrogenase FAD-containing subunit
MQKIVIIGTGFAGVWSALSAKRLLRLRKKEQDVEISIISPGPVLVLRPRLYEANTAGMTQDLRPLFKAAGIIYIKGIVDVIDTETQSLGIQTGPEGRRTLHYDRLILASGSAVVRPQAVQGLEEYAFDIDSLAAATRLENHFNNLAKLPLTSGRDTIVVCGGGFTGIELATELPVRLGRDKRVILVEGASEIGPELGPGPRPAIKKALSNLGVEIRLNSLITSIDSTGVTLKSGEHIPASTAIWTAGVQASPLTNQIFGPKDDLSRIEVDQTLRAKSSRKVFATGDAAHVLADTKGQHVAMMSCQHALVLGRVSGHNAAADLIGERMVEYAQEAYICCLDLGGYGAVICAGWDREVQFAGAMAKKVKQYINQTLIYLPTDVDKAIALADPAMPGSGKLFKMMLGAIAFARSLYTPLSKLMY